MQNKAQLIQRFNQARDDVRALLPNIDIHMQIYPGWTIKEVLAHLAGWDDATILALEAFVTGDPPPTPAVRGFDFYNAQTVAERATLNYEQIVREWELVREHLLPILDNIPDEKLSATIVSPWGPHVTIADLIAIMSEHEEEHAHVIRTRRENPSQPPQSH
jgi:hypothetical protein